MESRASLIDNVFVEFINNGIRDLNEETVYPVLVRQNLPHLFILKIIRRHIKISSYTQIPFRYGGESGRKRFGRNRVRQQLGAVGVRNPPDQVGRADGRILERPKNVADFIRSSE